MSPTARSLKWLRDRGWIADKVEQRLSMPGKPWANLRDLWGFIDIAAVHPDGKLMFIQVTSSGNLAARIDKAAENAPDVVHALTHMLGVSVEFHGWAKRGPRGKAKRWTLRRIDPWGKEIP